jgi:hypothetical protein
MDALNNQCTRSSVTLCSNKSGLKEPHTCNEITLCLVFRAGNINYILHPSLLNQRETILNLNYTHESLCTSVAFMFWSTNSR